MVKLIKVASSRRRPAGEAIEQYLKAKARKKSIDFDRLYLNQLKEAFGAARPLVDITAARISTWKGDKLAGANPRTGQPHAAASINRPLAALRHLLQLAHEEWGALEAGLRRGELLGLTWDRVDLSRGLIRLEVTKSGKRREVPMRPAVYDTLTAGRSHVRVGGSVLGASGPRSRTRWPRPSWRTFASPIAGTTSPPGGSCEAGACRRSRRF